MSLLPVLVAKNQEIRPEILSDEDIYYGLGRHEGPFGPILIWTVDPDIDVVTGICQHFAVANIPSCKPKNVKVEEIAQGSFNRVFKVDVKVKHPSSPEERADTGYTSLTQAYTFAFRVSLPVNPMFKTMSEAATLTYLKINTTIPVPGVLAFNASNGKENPLRFEWMLETFMPGKPLEEMFYILGDTGRRYMIQQLVRFQAEIFKLQHDRIGSIYNVCLADSDPEILRQGFSIGEIGTVPFFQRDRLKYKHVNRGPFKSSTDWIASQLSIILDESYHRYEQFANQRTKNVDEVKDRGDSPELQHGYTDRPSKKTSIVSMNAIAAEDNKTTTNAQREINKDKDEEELNIIGQTRRLVVRLLDILPIVFPETNEDSVERTIISHQDLSLDNIHVDKKGTITAILDWENLACLPLWAACDCPLFLRAGSWNSLPDPKDYPRGEDDHLYKDRLHRYQVGEARAVFWSGMKAECPEWIKTYKNSRLQRGLLRAVELCDQGSAHKSIDQWLDTNFDNKKDLDNPATLEL